MAEDIPFGSFAPSSPQQAVDAVTALRRMHPDWARQIALHVAPGLMGLQNPEPSYDSRLRASGGLIGPQGQLAAGPTGKLPDQSDPRVGPALYDAFNLMTAALPTGAGAKASMIAAPFAGKLARAATGIETAAPKGIRAYHGSPHDFDRFDISRIGTGEGAQSYGHGLYFAENPAVAASYERTLPQSTDVLNAHVATFNSRAPKTLTDADRAFAKQVIEDRMLNYGADNLTSVADVLKRQSTFRPQNFDEVRKVLASMDERPGRMYEVNINARPEQFLDWDKPRGAQSQPVRSGLDAVLGPSNREAGEGFGLGGQLYRDIGMSPKNSAAGAAYMPNYATDALREAGIPGIKYLDQGSRPQVAELALAQRHVDTAKMRLEMAQKSGDADFVKRMQDELAHWENNKALLEGTAKQTSNYVLFSDDIIKILRKYGLAGAVAPTAIAGATSAPPFGFAPQ